MLPFSRSIGLRGQTSAPEPFRSSASEPFVHRVYTDILSPLSGHNRLNPMTDLLRFCYVTDWRSSVDSRAVALPTDSASLWGTFFTH